MFEFKAKPKPLQKGKMPQNKPDSTSIYKPLMLEKNYINEQEKVIKTEFLNK